MSVIDVRHSCGTIGRDEHLGRYAHIGRGAHLDRCAQLSRVSGDRI